MMWHRWFTVLLLIGMATVASSEGAQGQDIKAPSQSAYPPPGGRGRVVILLSGQGGPRRYEALAGQVAKLGYYAVLLNGNDMLSQDLLGGKRLQAAIDAARASPYALPGKVAVVGYSMGGGAALWYAAPSPEYIAGIIAYYPATSWITNFSSYTQIKDIRDFVPRIKVPVLMFAGEEDTFNYCCLITNARTMAESAKQLGVPLELVSYPKVQHAFNLGGMEHNDAATLDSWQRTVARLANYLGR